MIASTQTNHPIAVPTPSRTARSSRLDAACTRLKAAGLRITQPRIAILDALLQQTHPVAIEQLHGLLSRARCDLVTVYRCLAAFEELGLVRRCFQHNGTALFQISLHDKPVYHVINRVDGSMQAIDPELTAELQTAIANLNQRLTAQGYENVDALVEFFTHPSPTASRAHPERIAVSS